MYTLTSEHVEQVFLDCLFKNGEDTSNYIKAIGIINNVGLHSERLEAYRSEIELMLSELPDEFKASIGGGWSFLNMCNDKNGNQWTDLHLRMEQLVQLGIGIDKIRYALPKDLWAALPAGMPYIQVIL